MQIVFVKGKTNISSALRQIIKRAFRFIGLDVRRRNGYLLQLASNSKEFQLLYEQIKGYTLVSQDRCFMLYQLVKYANAKQGQIAEVGVYKGGTAKLISKAVTETAKTVHLFDTFSGMPPTDASKDLHQQGDFHDTSLDSVKKYLRDCENVQIYQGFFPHTSAHITDMKFSFVHVDVDIYKSVADCCTFFYPRMATGGIMIFDDYGFRSCPGAKMAVEEFFSDKPEYPCHLPTGQCFIIKI